MRRQCGCSSFLTFRGIPVKDSWFTPELVLGDEQRAAGGVDDTDTGSPRETAPSHRGACRAAPGLTERRALTCLRSDITLA